MLPGVGCPGVARPTTMEIGIGPHGAVAGRVGSVALVTPFHGHIVSSAHCPGQKPQGLLPSGE